jgi:hypothetical protein
MSEVLNAIITGATISNDDHGLLTAYVHTEHLHGCQGFGGYALYLPKSFTHHQLLSAAGHFLWRVMEIAGVSKWEDLQGKTLRVRIGEDRLIKAIGHIVKDDWFCPGDDFGGVK